MGGRPSGWSASFRPVRRSRALLTLLALACAGTPALGQPVGCTGGGDTREEQIACLQAAKAAQLRPYQETAGEKVLDRVEAFLGAGEGAYPWLGSVYPGGLLGIGAGYRRTIGDTGVMNVLAAWSFRNYKLARLDLKLPELAGRRVTIAPHAMWLDAPAVDFYGTGLDTTHDTTTTYAYAPAVIGGNAAVRVTDWFIVGAGGEAQSVETNLAAGDIRYLIARAAAGIDWRLSPGYSRTGGLYRIEWAHHDARSGGPFAFDQIEAEGVQLVPLFRQSSVLALRGLVTTTDTSGGNTVPVFMLPSLVGSNTLRGYPSWRFRDRHRLLLSGEYRWMASQVIDMAIFVDAGTVAARRGDLRLRGLKKDVGVGIRLHGPTFTAVRLDLARGTEGWVINLGGGAAF
jgi:outer membrane translocation and assembly module TamA